MAIIRAPRDNKFTILQNCIFEKCLSWRAVGLLAYLLSKPDHWKIKISDLIRQVADSDNPTGRDATYAILKELMKAGFLVRDGQGKSDDGTWGSANYYIYDVPVSSDSPCTDSPYTAQPYTAEASTLISTESEEVLKEGSTEDKKNTGRQGDRNRAERFDEFWKAYPRKVKKPKALDIWKRRNLDEHADDIIADVEARKRSDPDWLESTRLIPHPTSYLNAERWTDEWRPQPVRLVHSSDGEQDREAFIRACVQESQMDPRSAAEYADERFKRLGRYFG